LSSQVFALVDCNSFYCSCERLFRPELKYKPVIVLSNNDGCAIARTTEAKALGIKMGDPYFKIKEFCEKNEVSVFSTNFSLYTNISERVMQTLKNFAPEIQVYSIDEAFLDLSGMNNLVEHGQNIKNAIYKNVGIPVGVGIAPTKVLAKVANHLAKKSLKANGVVSLMEKRLQDVALERTAVGDIWGIGRKSAEKLNDLGVVTAKDFRDFADEDLIQSRLTKVGLQIKHELMGIQCFSLELDAEKKKEIMCSRSFAQSVCDIESLKECIANYITDACEKLRAQASFCTELCIFARTSEYQNTMQYYMYEKMKLKNPTCDTHKLIEFAFSMIEKGYRDGVEYKKAGVRLMNFFDATEYQIDFLEPQDQPSDIRLMGVIDRINLLNGGKVVKSMACGTQGISWRMNRNYKSPDYTTKWSELKKFY
jgi:DNA polymerase V